MKKGSDFENRMSPKRHKVHSSKDPTTARKTPHHKMRLITPLWKNRFIYKNNKNLTAPA
ncbi:hypothetical protein BSM4216_0072 [Bacillus smithii]|nr:hypothetical protein BSM4216_0072 [Bacillus smithii]